MRKKHGLNAKSEVRADGMRLSAWNGCLVLATVRKKQLSGARWVQTHLDQPPSKPFTQLPVHPTTLLSTQLPSCSPQVAVRKAYNELYAAVIDKKVAMKIGPADWR